MGAMHKWIAGGLVAVGLLLLGYMVVYEGEPGALPLGLIAIGIVWFFVARRLGRPSAG